MRLSFFYTICTTYTNFFHTQNIWQSQVSAIKTKVIQKGATFEKIKSGRWNTICSMNAQIISNNEGTTCTWWHQFYPFNVQNQSLILRIPYALFQRGKECRKLQTREPQFQTLLYFTNAVLKMMTHINRNIYLHMAFKDISVMRLVVLWMVKACRFKNWSENTPGIWSELLAVISKLGVVTCDFADVSRMINII